MNIDRSDMFKKGAKTAVFQLKKPIDIKQQILKFNPVLFCINDDEHAVPEDRARLKSLLCELFPNVQPWEKNSDNQIEPVFDNENSVNIVFSMDNNYVKYFGVLLQSIIDNSNPEKKI